MTGGGVKAKSTVGVDVTFGVTLHCDLILSNDLEVNRGNGRNSHKWLIDKAALKTARCINDPSIAPAPPVAPFNTFIGTAYGEFGSAPTFAQPLRAAASGRSRGRVVRTSRRARGRRRGARVLTGMNVR